MPSSGSHESHRTTLRTLQSHVNSTLHIGHSRPSTELNKSQASAADSRDKQFKKDRRRRVLAYYTHAIVAFHAFGFPLSGGLILEYFHNSLFLTTPLRYISVTVAIQWVGTFAMEPLAAATYRWKHWRWCYFAVSVALVLCHAVMARGVYPWGLSLGMRALVGLCLGFMRSTTLYCLASHYNDDIAGVSMQSGAASMAGALVHSLVVWSYLRVHEYRCMAWAAFYIVLFTLVPTLGGLFPATMQENTGIDNPKRPGISIPRLGHRKSTQTTQSQLGRNSTQVNSTLSNIGDYCLLYGYSLVFAYMFVWPIFFPLLLSSRPIYAFPEYTTFWLLGTFGAGIVTAAVFARAWPGRELGVMNAFTAAAIFAGCLVIIAAWLVDFWSWGLVSVMYGLCLGPLLALHRKVFELICRYQRRVRFLSAGLGVVAFGGVSITGLMIQASGNGSIALTISGAMMLVGGLCMGLGRWLKYPTKYVVI